MMCVMFKALPAYCHSQSRIDGPQQRHQLHRIMPLSLHFPLHIPNHLSLLDKQEISPKSGQNFWYVCVDWNWKFPLINMRNSRIGWWWCIVEQLYSQPRFQIGGDLRPVIIAN
jgi:hypothetical protein